MKRPFLQSFAVVGVVVLLLLGAALAWLAFPGEPSKAATLNFEGFATLPEHGVLNVMDYLTSAGDSLYVTDVSTGSVFKITLDRTGAPRDAKVAEEDGGPGAHGVALVPSRGLAFVTRSGEKAVDVFDTASLAPLGHVPVAEGPDAILYDPDADLIYVANGEAGLATLIDPRTRTVAGAIPLGGKPEFPVLDPRTGQIFQNLADRDAIVAIDVARRAVAGRWSISPCQEPSGLAIDPARRRLFAVCAGNALLVVFDMDRHQVVATAKVADRPDSVAYDPKLQRLYAIGVSGDLTVIQQDGPDAYRVIERIATHLGAHTLVIDPSTHRVFVAYASLFAAPRVAVFSPKTPARGS